MSVGSELIDVGSAPTKAHLFRSQDGLGQLHKAVVQMRRVFEPLGAFTVEEWTNLATADVDGYMTAQDTATTAKVYGEGGLAFNGASKNGTAAPRPASITTTGDDAKFNLPLHVVVTGVDSNGDTASETLTVTEDTNAGTVVGKKPFVKLTKVEVPANVASGGTIAVGFGAPVGLSLAIKSRAGAPVVTCEITGGVSGAPTGTFLDVDNAPPNGSYEPDSAPDGTKDYALVYEYAL